MATDRLARGGVLVVGGGYAGSVVARRIGECTIVNPENYMLFRPLLAEAASGTIEPRHVVVPLRQLCPKAELIVGNATRLDPESRTVFVQTEGVEYGVRYWNLVIALGAVTRSLPIPGLSRVCARIQRPRGRDRASQPRAAPSSRPRTPSSTPEKRHRHLGFVFVGAGYAGTEALAELNDLVRDAMRYYPRLKSSPQRWVLVEARDRILPELPPRLSAYTAKLLERRGVEIRTETRLESVEAERATLSGGTVVPTHTVVWTAGVSPILSSASGACPSTSRAASASTSTSAWRVATTSGRSATAHACRTRPPRPPTPRRASTRFGRRGASRAT